MLFFFNDPAATEIYPLSLHDALPICRGGRRRRVPPPAGRRPAAGRRRGRSEEHTSELQSHSDLVCRLLLEKTKTWGSITARRSTRSSVFFKSAVRLTGTRITGFQAMT